MSSIHYWQGGPDAIVPANSYTSAKLAQPVILRLGSLRRDPLSLYTMFKRTVERVPNHSALGELKN
jgi:hypothetical protein